MAETVVRAQFKAMFKCVSKQARTNWFLLAGLRWLWAVSMQEGSGDPVVPVPGCATSVTSHVTRLDILLSCGKCRSSLPSVLDIARL